MPVKMPETIDSALFAPCGMNCLVCYRHCYHKKPCAGCLSGDGGKPEHCRKCAIKASAQEKSLTYYYQCPDYPCKRIKLLERSYNTRYHTSLIENSRYVQQHGLGSFMERQRVQYTCPSCGGVISLHGGECSDCQEKQHKQEEKV